MRASLLKAGLVVGLALVSVPASAQLDSLAILKTVAPNVILVVDTANRMQRDAATDLSTQTTATATSTYYDPFLYTKTGAAWETGLGITAANTASKYRRKYVNLAFASAGSADKFTATTIQVSGDQDTGYSIFGAATRLSIARGAMYQAISENKNVVRFGLIKMRQKSPSLATQGNSGPVVDSDAAQQTTETGSANGRWNVSRPTVQSNSNNGSQSTSGLVVKADVSTANTDVLDTLSVDLRGTWRGPGAAPNNLPSPLIPAGNDDTNTVDAPVRFLLDDAKTEAARLVSINNDPTCRNTVVILIVGGGEGNTAGYTNADLEAGAANLLNVSGRRVPVYVIAIAPPASDVAGLQAIATKSGGVYTEVTKAQIDAALAAASTAYPSSLGGTVIVPEVVKAINVAVAHTFATSTDFNTAPTASVPIGPSSEYQTTSPIVGTVDLTNAKDINGNLLPLTVVTDKSGTLIPQRSNLMVTTGLTVPTTHGLGATLRGFRVYVPTADATQLSGYKFVSAGTRLWTACVPGAGCAVADSSLRNLYTADSNGSLLAFTAANAAALAPLMNMTIADATVVISYVRDLPLGAIIDSTPAIMNPPSLDPPPDNDYPAFASANKGRRSLIWVGTNRGIIEAIDARLGIEVWGFIPLNLLPKLKTLRDGQSIGKFDYFADGSPKIADVKVDGTWRTHMIIGEGPGGTFYQSFDVTLPDMAASVTSSTDDISSLLTYFSSPARIALNWTFPKYSDFDPAVAPYGDIKTAAPAIEKTVGQTWSDPAVGQIVSASGPFSVLIGSGFFPYTTQQQANRGGTVAGTTFYILSAKDGTVYTSKNVGSDNLGETVDDCATLAGGCTQLKNALQSDPVATGPTDSRFITKAYNADLDGRVWRFDIGLDASSNPTISTTTKLYESTGDQPIFSSMATVNVGGTKQYVFFGTGSDQLPATPDATVYHLINLLDNGATGSVTFSYSLQKTAGKTQEERMTAFPAVAGDIVFFTTTLFKPATPCTAPDARLYAFTFIGGPAYDNSGDNVVTGKDTALVKTVAGQRATAPFVVDQHLAFAAGGKIEIFGDKEAFNNGVGQAGVRILSWRDVR